MKQTVKCYNCGKIKEWKQPDPEPQWFTLDIKNPHLPNSNTKITVQLCSKKCVSGLIRKEMRD